MRMASPTAIATVRTSSTIERTPDLALALRRTPTPSESPSPVGRPVGEERLTDDPAPLHRPPEAAVLRIRPVVAHHVVVPPRDDDRPGKVTVSGGAARNRV